MATRHNIGKSMQITINGDSRDLPDGSTVSEMLKELGINANHVAVERNRELIPRRAHTKTTLAEGDRVEIVTLVGGG